MHKLVFCFLLSLCCVACIKNSNTNQSPQKKINLQVLRGRNLDEIKKSGKLKAITTYSGTTYFLYRGRPMGFEYELLKKFAEHLGVELEVIIARDENKLIEMLNDDIGDVIAYGLTITNQRKDKINFTEPLYLSHQVLVQKKPDNWRKMKTHKIKEKLITNPLQLLEDTVSVKLNSSYAQRLAHLSAELGGKIYIDSIPGNMSTDEIFDHLSKGKIKYSIIDENIASIYVTDFPNIDISTKMSFSQRIAWGVRKNSTELEKELNKWILKTKKTIDYQVIYNKYFKNKRSYRKRSQSEFYSLNNYKISPYDSLIKKYAKSIGWDWRLVAAIAYQESQFNPIKESWAGAKGLMQIMPKTAEYLQIKNVTDPEQSLKGGTKYLQDIWQSHQAIPDSLQRIKFTLASYNGGLYHIKDAQRMAEYLGLNPNIWDKNVEVALLKLNKPEYYKKDFIRYGYLRARQPYNYVRDVFYYYHHYKTFIPVANDM